MTASQMRIAETIDAFYGDAGTRDGVSRSYKQAVEDLDGETIKALDGPYRYLPTALRVVSSLAFNRQLTRLDPRCLTQFPGGVPTSPISTNVSRSETTNYWITIPCAPR